MVEASLAFSYPELFRVTGPLPGTVTVEEQPQCVCVYYCRTFYKAVRVGEEESGGHVL